jgi:intraflagellar transport protein 74
MGQAVPATPGQTAGFGISLNTEVNVSDRPVTQQGMMGMRVGTAGPGRQVQDASFFMGKLHAKMTEITSEIERLHKEIEQDAKDKSQYAQLERKYETLAGEVRDLEGQLADYNLAMDKLRSATDPHEIRQVQEQLHHRNGKEAEEVDRIFIMRQEQEASVRRMESEMNEIHMKHQDKINTLAPQKLQRYKEMLEEHHQSEVEIEARSQELEMLMHAIHQKEAELSSDRYREEYDLLEKQARKLQKEREAAQEEARTAMMDPNEARAVLLAKVKEDKAKMETLEKVLQVEDDEIQELRKSLSELKNDLDDRTNGKSGGNDPAQQYDKLAQLDQEMTAFLDSFPTKKDEELHAQRQAQLMVVKLLEHISSTIAKEDKILPSANAAHLEEMRSDLTFKERQLESSVSTKQRLTMELQKRQAELDKVNTLDTKISLELGSLLQKMDTMTTDMTEFAKIDELKETHMQTKQFLQRAKQQYIRRRDAMKQQVNALQMQLENLKQETANHDTAKSLEALEQKLRHHEQNIFHLKEYIDTKSREINYEHVKQDCLKTLTELNALRVKQQGVLNNL